MPSNEELAVKAKTGDREALESLWEHNIRFIHRRAQGRLYESQLIGNPGVTVEDLEQAGYFAIIDAVRYFDPEKGISFLGYLKTALKNSFSKAQGIKTSKRDMLHFADSLDKPLSDDGVDGESQTVGNMVADPNDVIAEVEDKIYRRELHDVLQERLNYCTEEQQRILKMRYTCEMTSAEIAKMMDVRTEYVNSEIAKAFRTLRAPLAYACLKKFTG